MLFKRRSVASVAIASIAVTTSLLFAGICTFLLVRDRHEALQNLRLQTEVSGDQLASGLSLSLWNLDEVQVHKILESGMGNRDICGVSIKGEGIQGIQLGRSHDGKVQKTGKPVEGAMLVTVKRPVVYAGKTLGELQLVATPEYIYGELQSRFVMVISVIATFEVMLLLCLSLLIWRMVLNPLKELESFASAMSQGHTTVPRIDSRGFRGELLTLKESIERMVQQLQDRYLERVKEAELRRSSEERMRAVYDSVNDAILIQGRDSGLIIDMNSRACEMLALPRDRILGAGFGRFLLGAQGAVHNPDAPDRFDEDLFECECKRGEAQRFWVEVSRRRAHIDDKDCHLLVMRDISDRKQQEEERRKLQNQLYQSQKLESLGVLAGGIAHDFNNILSAIIGYGELAKEDTQDRPDVQEYLDDVLKASTRAKDLVRQILVFSRQSKLEFKPLYLEVITKEVVKLLRATFPDSIEVVVRHPEQLPAVLADPTQIHQVLMNLCTNAEHAMRNRPGRLTLSLELFHMDAMTVGTNIELPPGQYIRLNVEDTGHGMNELTMSHVFDPFFTTKKAGEGTGLGLSMVHGIMKSLHGTVSVYSRVGEGTVFSLFFPVHMNQGESEDTGGVELKRGVGQRVLFVDNEKALCRVAERVFPRLGYQVVAIPDPLVALTHFMANSRRYDLVMSDLSMPGMSGLELASRLRHVRPDIPVLIATGYLSVERHDEAKSLGVSEVLLKPVDNLALAEALHRLIGKQVPTDAP